MYVYARMHTCMGAYIHTYTMTSCIHAFFYFVMRVCNGYLTLLVFTLYFPSCCMWPRRIHREPQKLVTLLWTTTPMFLGGFFAFLVPMETGMNTL